MFGSHKVKIEGELLEQAKRVDPYFDPSWYWHLLGAAYFNARRYDDAVDAFGLDPSRPRDVVVLVGAGHRRGTGLAANAAGL